MTGSQMVRVVKTTFILMRQSQSERKMRVQWAEWGMKDEKLLNVQIIKQEMSFKRRRKLITSSAAQRILGKLSRGHQKLHGEQEVLEGSKQYLERYNLSILTHSEHKLRLQSSKSEEKRRWKKYFEDFCLTSNMIEKPN